MAARKKTRPAEPPELPELNRRLKFGVIQMVGLAALMLIPILALFSVFGLGEAFVSGRSSALALTVEYPPRLRHGAADVVVTEVTNTSSSAMDTVTVIFDSSYVGKVSEPRFTPPVSRAFELDLVNIAPGESRRIELAFYADEYLSHSGEIRAAHGADTARVTVETFVFP